jgi:hypothetical protein
VGSDFGLLFVHAVCVLLLVLDVFFGAVVGTDELLTFHAIHFVLLHPFFHLQLEEFLVFLDFVSALLHHMLVELLIVDLLPIELLGTSLLLLL